MTGAELKERIKSRGWRMSDLAKKLGTTNQNMYYIFDAKSVKMEKIERIAEAMEITPAELLGIEIDGEREALLAQCAAKDAEIARLNKVIDNLLAIVERRKRI